MTPMVLNKLKVVLLTFLTLFSSAFTPAQVLHHPNRIPFPAKRSHKVFLCYIEGLTDDYIALSRWADHHKQQWSLGTGDLGWFEVYAVRGHKATALRQLKALKKDYRFRITLKSPAKAGN